MARGSGTGSPIFFHCAAASKEWPRPLGRPRDHRVELTGRRRPYRAHRATGHRSTLWSREYRCSCGHVGWSNHMDLAVMAGEDPDAR